MKTDLIKPNLTRLGSILLILASMFLISCVNVDKGKSDIFTDFQDVQTILEFSNETKEDISLDISDSNNILTFRLLRYFLKGDQKNSLIFSPYSLYSAMILLYEGSEGATKKALKSFFYFDDFEETRRNYYILNSKLLDYGSSSLVSINVSNALVANNRFRLNPEYSKILKDFYNAELFSFDFIKEKFDALKIVNKFISDSTSGKINKVVNENMISEETLLLLVNVVYFKSKWKYDFEKTQDEYFYLSPSNKFKIPMMKIEKFSGKRFGYYEDDLFQVLEMPYENEDYSMLIFLPRFGKQKIYEKDQDGKILEKEVNFNYTIYDLNLSLDFFNYVFDNIGYDSDFERIWVPKFKINSNLGFDNILKKLGLKEVFCPIANFSRISETPGVCVSSILQVAFIEVNEKYTEAGAATIISVIGSSAPSRIVKKVSFKADHPFVFFIIHRPTRTILFSGIFFGK
ncbi:MAG: serpin family protein [Candidatus Woesearchaeota archaeon]